MSNTEGSGKRRRGSHFAEPGTKSNINWGGWDDENELEDELNVISDDVYKEAPVSTPSDNSSYIATDVDSDISYTASLDLEDVLDAGTPRSTLASATGSFERIPTGTGALFTTRDTVGDTTSFARFAFNDEGISSVRMADSKRPHITSTHEPSKPTNMYVSVLAVVLALSVSAFVAYVLVTQFILA